MVTRKPERPGHDPSPQDSGEWWPVPLRFKKVPPSFDTRIAQAFGTATLNTLLQAMFGSLLVWFALEHLNERHSGWVILLAFAIGLVTSAYAAGMIAHQQGLGVWQSMNSIMHGQLWWCVLLLIPCYGWAILVLLSLPCAMGSLIGGLVGGRLGQPQGAWK